MRKTWLGVFAVLGLAALGIGALCIEPLAWRMAKDKAARRGVELSVRDFDLGWFEAELGGVQVRLPEVPSVRIELDRVSIQLSPSGAVTQIRSEGGAVRVQGAFDEVRRQAEAFIARQPRAATTREAGKGSSRVFLVRDLDVRWIGALPSVGEQAITGLHVERTPEGLRVGADLLEFEFDRARAQLAGVTMNSSSAALASGKIQQLGAAEARLSWNAVATPGSPSAANRAAPVEPDVSPGAGLLEAKPERTARIRWALDFLRGKLLPRLPDAAHIERLWFSYARSTEHLEVGPNRLTAKNDLGQLLVELVPKEHTRGTPLELSVRVPRHELAADEAAVTAKVQGGPVALSTLGLRDGPFGLQQVARTFLSGTAEGRLSSDARTLTAHGRVSLEGLSIDSRSLSEQIVVFPGLVVQGRALVHTDGTRIAAEDWELALGEARFLGALTLERQGDALRVEGRVAAPLVSCQALVDSAPRGLLGPVEAMKFNGTLSLKSSLELDTSALAKMQVHFDFENGCKATAVPAIFDPEQFRGRFAREVTGAGDLTMRVEFGPTSANWVSYDAVSRHVEAALLVSEDGRFFRHDGFDDRAIESAIFDNAKAGRFVRGASTISMQLAKNLYLSRNKTLSRKLQEAALTSLLEQSFDKRQLLELYVNVVEFGPGIYGIGPAAEYYFNTTAAELTTAQAFFLASVLPNPSREFFGADGVLKEGPRNYVHRLLEVAKQRGRLSDEDLSSAQAEELVFGRASTTPAASPLTPGTVDTPTGATITRDEMERPAHPPAPPRRGIEL